MEGTPPATVAAVLRLEDVGLLSVILHCCGKLPEWAAGAKLDLKPNEALISKAALARQWKCSPAKITAGLKRLRATGRVVCYSGGFGTVVAICPALLAARDGAGEAGG